MGPRARTSASSLASYAARLAGPRGRSAVRAMFAETMLSRFGVPQPVRQYGFGPYRLDLAYPEPKVAIEIDSAQRHSGTASYRRDRRSGTCSRAKAGPWN